MIDAADRRGAPSFWLLPLIALWANLHGGFIFGLMMVAPVALDAVVSADAAARKSLALRWVVFGLAALVATCCTPYGWHTMVEPIKILALGSSLPLVTEFRPVDFGKLGTFEICLLLGLGFALLRGIQLTPTRILLVLGLLHMALFQNRATEMSGAACAAGCRRAARQTDWRRESLLAFAEARSRRDGGRFGGSAGGRHAKLRRDASASRPIPLIRRSQAVTELKKLNVERVFNDYDFGGYLIASGVAPFIDGRTDVYGKEFFVDHHNASAN